MERIEVSPGHAAIVDGVCLMLVVDGVFDPEEADFLEGMIRALLKVELDVARALVSNSLGRIQGCEVGAFVDQVVARLGSREEKHYLMVALQIAAMADGKGTAPELQLLEAFAAKLGLTPAEIQEVTQEARVVFRKLVEAEEVGLD